jgi:sarcosine oxidase subunit gamma
MDTHGITVSQRDGLGIASVIVRKSMDAALSGRVQERLGIELPQEPRRVSSGDIAVMGVGSGRWIATRENAANAFSVFVSEQLHGLASVADQSDGYVVFRLSGRSVRDVLCRVVPIDVHPSVFRVDDVAATTAAHMAVIMWRLADGADGFAVFELAVFRSFATSFYHVLSEGL